MHRPLSLWGAATTHGYALRQRTRIAAFSARGPFLHAALFRLSLVRPFVHTPHRVGTPLPRAFCTPAAVAAPSPGAGRTIV
eukprot:3396146-Prymnesium_polylepis.1